MIEDIITFLREKESAGDWLNIANTFHVQGTNKEKSDLVRRLWNKIQSQKQVNFVQVVNPDYKQPQVVTTTTSTIPKTYLRIQQLDPRIGQMVDEWEATKVKPVIKNNNGLLNKDNVLVIGDLHEPFCKDGFLEFCKKQQLKFNCGTVVFIGDIVDHHAQSFHNTDPDGLSAKDELILACSKLQNWYKAFPEATVLLGNHDRIVARKLMSVGISQRWLKPLGDVLGTPNWKFVEQHVYNNVLYVHGESGTALKKAQNELCSVVQGHSHTEGYVQLINGGTNFAMQVGCGIDFESYAFAYAQRGKKPILSCGVVLNQSPIIIPFV